MATQTVQSERLRNIRAAGIRIKKQEICVLDSRCIDRSASQSVSVRALKMELKNFMAHGQKEHAGDWFHEWSRTSRGTLSWDC